MRLRLRIETSTKSILGLNLGLMYDCCEASSRVLNRVGMCQDVWHTGVGV